MSRKITGILECLPLHNESRRNLSERETTSRGHTYALHLVFPPRPSMLPAAPPPSTVEFNLPPPPLPPPLPPPAPELRLSPPASRTIANTFLATDPDPSLTCAPSVLPVPALLAEASAPGLSMSALARSSLNALNQEAASARRTEKALRWSAAVRSFPVRLLLFA